MEHKYKGLYFEDFETGDKFFSVGRTITENDIITFARFSGDYKKIQTDIEFATKTIYQERIAHELLGLSVISGLAARLGFSEETVITLREIQWKIYKPIKIRDTVKAIFIVESKKKLKKSRRGNNRFPS